MNADTKLILSLVNRVTVRLPSNNGLPCDTIESDPVIHQTVTALTELSKYRLPTIVSILVDVIDDISKPPTTKSEEFSQKNTSQSQLYLLRMISACMQHHWKHCQESEDRTRKNSLYTQKNDTNSSEEFILTSVVDPPPLEEPLVKHIIQVMSRFIYKAGFLDDRDNGIITNHPSTSSSIEALTYMHNNSDAFVDILSSEEVDIYKSASQILAYVSASNWPIIFNRIKQRILFLTKSQEGENNSSEIADIVILECASLNRTRLGMVLEELCNSTLHLKKSAQMFVAVMLRRAIWNWITGYTAEFILLCRKQTRMEGSPEILFDIFNSLADTNKRKAVFWPLQTMLLILCPDIMMASSFGVSDVPNKKNSFIFSLKKAMKGERVGDIASICYVDLCKAATYVPQDDMATAIRQIVPDIENELIEKLFDIYPSSSSNNNYNCLTNYFGVFIDHRRLLADCIVAMFRLNSKKTINTLIPICFDPAAPTIFKIGVVKAALAIASETISLPWIPSISRLYNTLCTKIRSIFLESLGNKPSEPSNPNTYVPLRKSVVNSQKATKKPSGNQEKFEMILDILKLYQTDPNMAILREEGDMLEQNSAVMVAITTCLRDSSYLIREAAAECLYKLHSLHYMTLWAIPMYSFWSISSQILFELSKQLLNSSDIREARKVCSKEISVRKLLDLLQRLLISRNAFLEQYREVALNHQEGEKLNASIGLEVSLLILLCSPDPDICSLSIDCFGLLCTEAYLTDRLDSQQKPLMTIVENMACYTELTNNAGVVTGRKSQQRRIRRLLRMINHSSPGMLVAWEEAWNRWEFMTPAVVSSHNQDESVRDDVSSVDSYNRKLFSSSNWHERLRTNNTRAQHISNNSYHRLDWIDDERSAEWQNYAGFLAALGGVCLMTNPNNPPYGILQPKSAPSPFPTEHAAMVDQFVMKMVGLLACDHLIVREWVCDILGNDLSPALYHILFRHMENNLTNCFDSNNNTIAVCDSRSTLSVEQAISVLRQILDRVTDSNSDYMLFAVDFSTLIHQYALYLNQLGTSPSALKIKIKMCQLVESLMNKKESITLRQEFKLRNKLLEIVVEWTSDFSLKSENSTHSTPHDHFQQIDKLQSDLDLACLRTIVVLLNHLPLQPCDPVVDSDAIAVKSRIFYKYFTFFLKLLNRCRTSETETSSKSSHYETQLRNNSELTPLKNYTILALSNLLSANVDAGLKFSLSMAYHDDTRTRTAFMEVLTNILKQGTEFENLSETVMTDRYEKIIDMIVEDDLMIVRSLFEVCPSSDIENTANVLLPCFASRNKTMVLLNAAIEKEVNDTENETDLFRKTSIATRLLSLYAKTNGGEYVRSVLLPIFQKLSERPREGKFFELDPSKLGPDEDINTSINNVTEATGMFLDAICNSIDKAPYSFREICHSILNAVAEKFPEAKYTAVGSFIFLRFFCPAIVSPDTEGLIKNSVTFSRDMRRGFLMCTKVIQNLANNILFGAKETHMIVLNDFLISNIYKVAKFLRDISVPVASTDEKVNGEEVLLRMDDKIYSLLHRVLYDNIELISANIASKKLQGNADPNLSSSEWKRNLDKFANILAQLGRPPELTQKEILKPQGYMHIASNQLYADFMRRNSHRNSDSIISKRIFYESGTSKSGRPVFYFILQNVNASNIDFELLIYHILQTLERASYRHYELVIDVTQFSKQNTIPTQWVSQILQFINEDKSDHISFYYIYNANSYLRTFVKNLSNPVSHKFSKKIIFTATLTELHEYILPSELNLPKKTIELEMDASIVYFPVNMVLKYTTQVPVTMKISAEYVQVMTVRKRDIVFGLAAITKDIYHISDIDDISSRTSSSDEFNCKYTRENATLTFNSPKREAIVNMLIHNKRKYEMSRPTKITERTIRPSDVPGRLLNMALMNLGSNDPDLRLSSYNLLYALSRTFNFDIEKHLLDTKDLCVPSNSTEFIVNVSEKISATEPNLTFEFLNECVLGYKKSDQTAKYLCLLYMIPWLNNLSLYCGGSDEDIIRVKDIIRMLIDLTLSGEIPRLIQMKVWKTIAKVDVILDLVITSFLQVVSEYGIGSPQSETLANTLVTLSNIKMRLKLVSLLRKVIHRTSFKPTRSLANHASWPEMATLTRFILMMTFNNRGPVKRIIPELFHIVSLMAGVGCTVERSSVHGIVINSVQSLCTSMPISPANNKKLQILLSELSESKYRLLFGLNRSNTNAFLITPDTIKDKIETVPLLSVEMIVSKLLEVIQYAAPTIDIGNVWRARWMGLVANTAFQFNPAIQPRAFIVLGLLGKEEIDDDLLYQILVALRGALVIFNPSAVDSLLITSIMMCLKNVVRSLPADSRYLLPLFWVSVVLVEIHTGPTFSMAVELLQAVLQTLDANEMFNGDNSMVSVLLEARGPMADIARQLDRICGVNFETHFSFAIAGILIKGLCHSDIKETVYKTLYTFLDIQIKQINQQSSISGENPMFMENSALGYVAVLLPLAEKDEAVKDLLRINETDIDSHLYSTKGYTGIFEKLGIPDDTTALLLISLLVAMLNAPDNESERLFIYGLLSEAAMTMPQTFSLVYDSLIPKMNQTIVSSQTQPVIESIQSILLTACSNPSFKQSGNKPSQKELLEKLGFSALGDLAFSGSTSNAFQTTKLANEIMEYIIS